MREIGELGFGYGFKLIDFKSSGIIENGDKMLSVSLLAWYFFLLSVRSDISRCYLCDVVKRLFKHFKFVGDRSWWEIDKHGCLIFLFICSTVTS